VPIHPAELTAVLELVKRLEQILRGLIAQTTADEQRVTPAGEPPARSQRLR
jgi:hypothetical protein